MTTSNSSYDLIIIDCGPAGIAAALELQKYQSIPNFLIVEARNRVGGRTYTDIHTFDSNQPVDLGARWIHHIPQAKRIVEELRVNIKEYSSDKVDTCMLDAIRDKYEKIQDEQMRRLVDMNLAYIEHYEASNLNELSAKSYLKSNGGIETCDLTLSIGLCSFIEQIVKRNNLPSQLNTIVTNIVIAIDKNDPIRITTQDNRHYLSKYVLITIPLDCLKAFSIKFISALPDWKQNAIDKMGFGLLNKIFIHFFQCHSHDQVLTLFVGGNLAGKLEQETDEEIIEQIFQCLKRIYSPIPKPTKWLIT
ncbi:unnamed protein product [Rotaria sp. Silwood2]|nr:unnamed protein product [Rotaria sp. Silwood2]CAF2794949.1 unnamed protein product [Rotaria sp. Silwood2]CAF3210549.1 unnamed protein product [Rotaria sp. Silwood2]CAF4157723.1 unnamed protein product [Rotaria sp. Silwood2]CAF4270359.1 unnamed protein product [Rotaria sp. Silwood2]